MTYKKQVRVTKILRTEQHVSDISSQSAIQIQHIKRIFNIEGYEKDIFFSLIYILFIFSMQLIYYILDENCRIESFARARSIWSVGQISDSRVGLIGI